MAVESSLSMNFLRKMSLKMRKARMERSKDVLFHDGGGCAQTLIAPFPVDYTHFILTNSFQVIFSCTGRLFPCHYWDVIPPCTGFNSRHTGTSLQLHQHPWLEISVVHKEIICGRILINSAYPVMAAHHSCFGLNYEVISCSQTSDGIGPTVIMISIWTKLVINCPKLLPNAISWKASINMAQNPNTSGR